MGFGEGSLKQLRVVNETNPGETPASNMQIVPHKGDSGLDFEPNVQQSQNVNATGEPSQLFTTMTQVKGGYQVDPYYGAHDHFLWSLLKQSAWGSAFSHSGTGIAAVASGNKLTSTTSNAWNDLAPGDFVRVFGFADNDPFWARVLSRTTGANPELALDPVDVTLVDEAAGEEVTVMHSGKLILGTTPQYLSIEEAHLDIGQFWINQGCMPGTWNFVADCQQGCSSQFSDFLGLKQDRGSATFGTGTETAAPGNTIFQVNNGPDHLAVGAVKLNHATDVWSRLAFTVRSMTRPIPGAGIPSGLAAIGKNTLEVSGGIKVYAQGAAFDVGLNDACHDQTYKSIGFVISDRMASPHAWAFHLTEAKLTSGAKPKSQGQNSNLETDVQFRGQKPLSSSGPAFSFGLFRFSAYE